MEIFASFAEHLNPFQHKTFNHIPVLYCKGASLFINDTNDVGDCFRSGQVLEFNVA